MSMNKYHTPTTHITIMSWYISEGNCTTLHHLPFMVLSSKTLLRKQSQALFSPNSTKWNSLCYYQRQSFLFLLRKFLTSRREVTIFCIIWRAIILVSNTLFIIQSETEELRTIWFLTLFVWSQNNSHKLQLITWHQCVLD